MAVAGVFVALTARLFIAKPRTLQSLNVTGIKRSNKTCKENTIFLSDQLSYADKTAKYRYKMNIC